jgi:hypothetical protein
MNLCESSMLCPVYAGKPVLPYAEQPSSLPKNWYKCVRRKLRHYVSVRFVGQANAAMLTIGLTSRCWQACSS